MCQQARAACSKFRIHESSMKAWSLLSMYSVVHRKGGTMTIAVQSLGS